MLHNLCFKNEALITRQLEAHIMTKLVYRGTVHNADQNKADARVFRRPQLVYRGVAHNGVRTIQNTGDRNGATALVYRGFKTA